MSLGLLPGNGGTQRLTRQVGRGPALELLLTGRQVTPDEAQRAGPRRRAVFADEAAFDEHVARLAAGPPMAIAAIKRCVHVGGELSLDDGLALERELHRAAVPLQGRHRGPDRVRREARAGVRGRMSTTTRTTLERGAFLDGAAEPIGDDALTITDPADRRRGRARDERRRPRRSTAPCAPRRRPSAPGRAAAITDRGAVLHAGAEALLEHVDELAPGLVAEQGKTLREAKLELRKAADTLEHYAGLAKQVRGIAVHGLDPGVEGRVLRRPLGVVAAIVPWNFPTTLLSNKLGPALLCGNTVVAKPADTTPLHHPAPRRDPHRGGSAARRPQRRARRPARSPARRWSATRWCARWPSPARRPPGSASPRWPRRAPSA